MPTDVNQLNRMIFELSLELSKQSIRRQEQETASIKESATILTKISKLLGEATGIKVQDLGKVFTDGSIGFNPHKAISRSPKRAKKLK